MKKNKSLSTQENLKFQYLCNNERYYIENLKKITLLFLIHNQLHKFLVS
jgi:hypothetical protein